MKAGKGILVMLLGCFLVSGLWACQGSRQPPGPEVRPDPEASSEALPAETLTPVPPAKTQEPTKAAIPAKTQEPTGEVVPTKAQTPTKVPVPMMTQEPTGEQTPATFPAQDALLSREQVITLVLSRVPGAESGDITSLELEIEDGRWRYEGEVEYQGIEFEFEIDAQNGNVLVWEVDD